MHTAPPTLYAHTSRGDIAYQTVGSGPIDLLVLAGIGSTIEHLWGYAPVAAMYERIARFCRLIVFDRRGTGISDPLPTNVPPTWEDWADDILAVLDTLGITQAALLAERDAGMCALMFAASHPERVRALILGNNGSRLREAPGYPGLSEQRAEQFLRSAEESWGSENQVHLFVPSQVGNADFAQWLATMQRVACTPRRAVAELRYVSNSDARPVLPAIRAPTLILRRCNYMLTPVEQAHYMAEHIPGARLELLPGNDILVLLPGDEQVLGLIEEFLTGARPAAHDERTLATILFTDIAHSTEQVAQLGDSRWKELQARHYELVRQELVRFRGREVDNAGDGFFASFDGPARALRCAQMIQNGLRAKLQLEIRAGLHTGECERLDGKLSGLAVHIGSRIMGVAQPGQVLASSTVRDLVAGSGLIFREVGVHTLKGVPGQWPLFALEG